MSFFAFITNLNIHRRLKFTVDSSAKGLMVLEILTPVKLNVRINFTAPKSQETSLQLKKKRRGDDGG